LKTILTKTTNKKLTKFVEFGVAVELNAKAERNKTFLIEYLGRELTGHQYAHEQSLGTNALARGGSMLLGAADDEIKPVSDKTVH
jgi:hypothetical protein